jgi:hypothetical protein
VSEQLNFNVLFPRSVCYLLSLQLFAYQSCRQHTGGEKYEEPSGERTAEDVLRIASIVILSIFCAETLAKLIVQGLKYYLHHLIHLFDAIVIFTSFIVTLVLTGPLEEVVALFIFLRLWRVFRIIDGVAVSFEAEHEKKHRRMEMQQVQLEEKIKQLEGKLKEMQDAVGEGGKGDLRGKMETERKREDGRLSLHDPKE